LAFNAQGSRVIIVVVQVRAVKIFVAAVKALRKKGRGYENLRGEESLRSKLVEKLLWVPVISFCKISLLVTHVMPCYAEIGRSCPLLILIA
jgi:hypothetical protein